MIWAALFCVLSGAEPSIEGATRLWRAVVPSCSIVWHIHVPKTAGTSILTALRTSSRFVDLGKHAYVEHGRRHNWRKPDLMEVVRARNKTIVVSVETGLDDLVRLGYPWFEETCFFSIMREPREWVASAENHMRTTIKYRGRYQGTTGYFDKPNIQSRMLAPSATRGLTCAGTLGMLDVFVSTFTDAKVPHVNARPHTTNFTAELERVVRARYARDLDLYNVVSERGLVCW